MWNKLIERLLRNVSTESKQLNPEILAYGVEALTHTILSTVGLLFIGYVLNQLAATIAFIFVLYVCQTTGGGFHAQSHVACFIFMAVSLICSLLLQALFRTEALILLGLLAIIILLLFPLTLHENKQYLQPHTKNLKRISRYVTLLMVCVIAILFAITKYNQSFQGAMLGFLNAAISRLIAIFQRRSSRRV